MDWSLLLSESALFVALEAGLASRSRFSRALKPPHLGYFQSSRKLAPPLWVVTLDCLPRMESRLEFDSKLIPPLSLLQELKGRGTFPRLDVGGKCKVWKDGS